MILHEDEHLLVINKPPGWNTHAPSPFAGEGVYEWLKNREPRWSRKGGIAIIHRLDKETSGVLVFGKTREANRSLTEQFASRAVRKKYLLLTDRNLSTGRTSAPASPTSRKKSSSRENARPPGREFTIVSSMLRAGEKYVSRPLSRGGESAETHFSVVEVGNGRTLLQAEPVTGRTHQIRVHAAEHGFPILGDVLYGGSKAERVFLHAEELSLKHPVTGSPLNFHAPCHWRADIPIQASDALRAAIIDPQLTNTFRLVHGASDRRPGFYVDKLGDFILAQTENALDRGQSEFLEAFAGMHRSRGVYHKLLSRNVRGAAPAEASPRLLFGQPAPHRFMIRENSLTFELSFSEGYSPGLFLDQRDNRRRLLVNHIGSDFTLFPNGTVGAHVLNTFAYTCGFSVAAAKAGALVTSLDLSKKYLEWGQRNFALNELAPSQHDFIYGDAFDWLRRLAKKKRSFDCVLLDPPTFSQSKQSGTWQAEKDFRKLVVAALPLLKSGGVLFASTNAAKLEPENFLAMICASITKAGRKIVQQHYVPQPPDFPICREEPAYLKTLWLRIS